MDVVSKLGEGTRVTIRLPLNCETARKDSEIITIGRQPQAPQDDQFDNRVRISA
jgi:hypothetical protein